MIATSHPLVIVGAGLAGWTVARECRKLDATRSIVLVTSDSGDFYAKPTLSNAYAQKRTPEQLVTTPAQKMAETLQVELNAHTRFAVPQRFDQAGCIDGDLIWVVREELSQPSHIAKASIGIVSAHEQLLRLIERHRAIARQNLQTCDIGFVSNWCWSASRNPIAQRPPHSRLGSKPYASFMRHAAGRFRQQKAFLRKTKIDTAAADIPRDRIVIPFWSVTAKRQFKAILARELSMTSTGVAAAASQDRQEVLFERRRMLGGEVSHRDRHRGRQLIEFDNQYRLAIGLSFHHTPLIDSHEFGFIHLESDAMGNIGDISLVIGQRDNHAVNWILPSEFQLVRQDRQLSGQSSRCQQPSRYAKRSYANS